uniref:Glutamine rich 2 n=1 Tax=Otolemur garnettii TaxID=30611 RepID=H0XD07_OTOGA
MSSIPEPFFQELLRRIDNLENVVRARDEFLQVMDRKMSLVPNEEVTMVTWEELEQAITDGWSGACGSASRALAPYTEGGGFKTSPGQTATGFSTKHPTTDQALYYPGGLGPDQTYPGFSGPGYSSEGLTSREQVKGATVTGREQYPRATDEAGISRYQQPSVSQSRVDFDYRKKGEKFTSQLLGREVRDAGPGLDLQDLTFTTDQHHVYPDQYNRFPIGQSQPYLSPYNYGPGPISMDQPISLHPSIYPPGVVPLNMGQLGLIPPTMHDQGLVLPVTGQHGVVPPLGPDRDQQGLELPRSTYQHGMRLPGTDQRGIEQPGMDEGGQPGAVTPGAGQPGLVPPGVGQPGMVTPGVGQPGLVAPGVGQPGMVTIGAGQPGLVPPGVDQPGMVTPGADQPGLVPPGVGQPGMVTSGAGQPGLVPPGVGQPGMVTPGAGQPGLIPPGVGQAGMVTPGADQPGLVAPGVGQPSMVTPGAGQPGLVPPGVGHPSMVTPGADQAGLVAPGVGQPGMVTPGAGLPGLVPPGVGQPGMVTPGAGQPSMVTPGAGQPGMVTPGAGQPGVVTPGAGPPGLVPPGVGHPGVVTPRAGQPGLVAPGVRQPGMVAPGTGHLGLVKPGVDQRGLVQPGTGQRGLAQPGVDQRGLVQPETDQHGLVQPGPDQYGVVQSGMDQQDLVQPEMDQHGLEQPSAGLHGLVPPGMDETGLVQPGMDQSGLVQPGVDSYTVVQPVLHGLVQPGAYPPGLVQPGVYPPGLVQPGTYPPGLVRPAAYPPGLVQPGAYPPGLVQPGTYPPGLVQPGVYPPGLVQPPGMDPRGLRQPGADQQGLIAPGTKLHGFPASQVDPQSALSSRPYQHGMAPPGKQQQDQVSPLLTSEGLASPGRDQRGLVPSETYQQDLLHPGTDQKSPTLSSSGLRSIRADQQHLVSPGPGMPGQVFSGLDQRSQLFPVSDQRGSLDLGLGWPWFPVADQPGMVGLDPDRIRASRPPGIPAQPAPGQDVTLSRHLGSLHQVFPERSEAQSDVQAERRDSLEKVSRLETFRLMGELIGLYLELKEHLKDVEEEEASQTDLQKMQNLLARMIKKAIPPDLQEELKTLKSLAKEIRQEKAKLDKLQRMVEGYGDQEGGKELKGGQLSLQLGILSRVTVADIEKELAELRDSQERGKAAMENSVSEASLYLQDQLDKLRTIIESMLASSSTLLSMSMTPSKAHKHLSPGQIDPEATCPACSLDVSHQVSTLVRRYEQLQDMVNNLAASRPSKKARLQSQDEELLGHVQNAILQVQGDCEKLNITTGNLIEDHRRKQKDIDVLYQGLEKLEKEKANREHLEMEIDVKADKSALAAKVSRVQFDATTEQLNHMMRELVTKMSGQEQDWQKMLDKLVVEMDSKLDRLELDPLKQMLEDRWKSLKQQLKERSPLYTADEAAAMRRQLLAHFHCLSCDRPLETAVTGQIIPVTAVGPSLPGHRSSRPYTVFELEQVRQQSRSLKLGSAFPRGDLAQMERSVGRLRSMHSKMLMDIEKVQIHFGGSVRASSQMIRELLQAHCLNSPCYKRVSDSADYTYSTVPRRCGGSHTLTYPYRRNRLQHLSQGPTEEVQIAMKHDEVDILGLDGHIYKGRMDTKLPGILNKDATGNSKHKPKQSRPHRQQSLNDSTQLPSRPQSAQMLADNSSGN